MLLSARQTAELLGVSRTQISRLVDQGDLRATRVGNALLIESDSVSDYRACRPGRGRPIAARNAWRRIAEAGRQFEQGDRGGRGDHGDGIEATRRLAIATRRRAERRPLRILPSRLPDLLSDARTVVSGAAAGQVGGAPVRPGTPQSFYVSGDDFPQLVDQYRLREAAEPNVIARVVESDDWIMEHRVAPLFVAAIDALDDGDSRSAGEILRHLTARAHAGQR